MDKYIFLDIDGVIATPESLTEGLSQLYAEKTIKILNK
jgi:histidinol phosphatase-like enzyme